MQRLRDRDSSTLTIHEGDSRTKKMRQVCTEVSVDADRGCSKHRITVCKVVSVFDDTVLQLT